MIWKIPPKNLMHASKLSWAHICLFCFLRHFICYQNSRGATIHSVGWFLNYTRYCSPYATCMQTVHVSVSVIVWLSLSALASFLAFLNPALANMSRAVHVVPLFAFSMLCRKKRNFIMFFNTTTDSYCNVVIMRWHYSCINVRIVIMLQKKVKRDRDFFYSYWATRFKWQYNTRIVVFPIIYKPFKSCSFFI